MLPLLAAAVVAAAPAADAGVEVDPGVRIDFPRPGARLEGRWTAVTGWLDRSKYQYAAVFGAVQDEGLIDFYAPGGHVGLPMAPLFLDADGGFVAPMVPIAEGPTQIAAVPMDTRGYVNPVTVEVSGSRTSVKPVTVTASPDWGEVPLTVKLSALAAGKASQWEWSMKPPGGFEAGAPEREHTFTEPGPHWVYARALVDGRWHYGMAALQLTSAPRVGRETRAVKKPSRLYVVPTPFDPQTRQDQTVQWVLAIDGDVVRVFDARLKPRFTLTGLKAPQGLSVAASRWIYVADTGNDRVLRFDARGKLDAKFGVKGALTGVGETKFTGVREVFQERGDERLTLKLLLGDGKLYHCSVERCEASTIRYSEPALTASRIEVPPGDDFGDYGAAVKTPSGWVTRDGHPLSQLPSLWCGGPGLVRGDYLVGLDAEGRLVELVNRHERRKQKAPFAVTAVAVDHYAGRSERKPDQWYGPIHLFLAGEGILQERIFEPLAP